MGGLDSEFSVDYQKKVPAFYQGCKLDLKFEVTFEGQFSKHVFCGFFVAHFKEVLSFALEDNKDMQSYLPKRYRALIYTDRIH